MFKSLFISKNAAELGELSPFLEDRSIELIATSFLQFQPVSFALDTSYDVIFFGSPRAVTFFKSQYEIPSTTEIACVGGKTAALLASMGHPIAFNGADKGSINEVAASFAAWVGKRTVLFPVSSRSLGTISSSIPERQRIIVPCYKTTVNSREIPKADVYVFTSPSNVEGFLGKNKLENTVIVIAWGESTAAALKSNNQPLNYTLETPDLKSLLSVLTQL